MPNNAGQRPAPSVTEPAGSRENHRGDRLHPRIVAREIAKIATAKGAPLHPAECRRLAATYCATDDPGGDLELYLLSYADPTGERAVHAAMRGRS